MDEHNAYVQSVTPPNQFHMMELSEGWAPLCRILGVSTPNAPFPRANDAEAVEGLASQILIEAGKRWLGSLAVVGGLGYSVWYLCM